jgi:hypothetical protein
MRVNSFFNKTELAAFPRRSVYNNTGADRLGDVQERNGEFIARDRQGNIIGIFRSLSVAATECWRAAARSFQQGKDL